MNRQEWLQWRKKGIGGSDAPIIMGKSPWKTIVNLYEDKISDSLEQEESNFAIDMGNEVEPKVRSLFSLITNEEYDVALVEIEGLPIRASLDGRSQCKKKILEIKLSGKEDFELAKKKIVPEKYFPQCQHNLMASKADVLYYLSYDFSAYKDSKQVTTASLAIVEVYPDKKYQDELLEKELDFFNNNVLKKKPPVPTDKDYKSIKGITKQIAKWKALKQKEDEIAEEIATLRAEIIEACEKEKHPRLICGDVRIRLESRIGSVNYSKIPELKGVDLDPYRGKGSASWKFEPIK